MPVTGRAMALYGPDLYRSWQRVNRDFEQARDDLEMIYSGSITLAGEVDEVMEEYRRARTWIYALLPEVRRG